MLCTVPVVELFDMGGTSLRAVVPVEIWYPNANSCDAWWSYILTGKPASRWTWCHKESSESDRQASVIAYAQWKISCLNGSFSTQADICEVPLALIVANKRSHYRSSFITILFGRKVQLWCLYRAKMANMVPLVDHVWTTTLWSHSRPLAACTLPLQRPNP